MQPQVLIQTQTDLAMPVSTVARQRDASKHSTAPTSPANGSDERSTPGLSTEPLAQQPEIIVNYFNVDAKEWLTPNSQLT